jgi:hypothetical protein|tara:strand:- start:329 stop:1216 length:888 start_codon:yes stop_codon:yes gene_type:complete
VAEQNIELELPEEEVDIHEADVIQESTPDVDTSDQAIEETQHTEEVDEYSAGVKKRIDKLTYRMREAERREQEAIKFAQNVQAENQTLQTKLTSSDSTLVNEYDARVKSDSERARKALKEAQELGDAEAIALATEAVAKTSLEAQNVQRLQRQQKVRAEKPPAAPQQQAPQPPPPPIDPITEDWAERNKWFGQDRVMTQAAMDIHEDLISENNQRGQVVWNPQTPDYYKEVDKRMQEYFPQKFDQAKPVQQPAVAGPSRGVGSPNRGARKVSLSPSQVAIAKRIGVPLEEYAKYV